LKIEEEAGNFKFLVAPKHGGLKSTSKKSKQNQTSFKYFGHCIALGILQVIQPTAEAMKPILLLDKGSFFFQTEEVIRFAFEVTICVNFRLVSIV
jgi:hypothetical protein